MVEADFDEGERQGDDAGHGGDHEGDEEEVLGTGRHGHGGEGSERRTENGERGIVGYGTVVL